MSGRSELLVLPIAILFTGMLLWFAWQSQPEQPQRESTPDFTSISDVSKKKETFFQFLLPKVRKANNAILAERQKLLTLTTKIDTGESLGAANQNWLQETAIKYRVTEDVLADSKARRKLIRRINSIPASLVLAQAANESGWGSARFARNGNNYFGLWCWQRNCGMVPTDREPSKKHEVASFDTIDAGISYYLLTLNSHPAYQALRDRRANAINNDKPVTGLQLAEGLTRYSERGEAYVEEIQSMISYNKLQRFNR